MLKHKQKDMINPIVKVYSNGPETIIIDTNAYLSCEVLDARYKMDKIKTKLVYKMTLNTGRELVFKEMKFDSKEVHITRGLYKEYTVGNMLGLFTDGVAKYLIIWD